MEPAMPQPRPILAKGVAGLRLVKPRNPTPRNMAPTMFCNPPETP